MTMSNNSKNVIGKKVFFLYPHSIIHDELFNTIIENEYEAYILKNYKKAALLLSRYNNSILYINIDTELKEAEWIEYVKVLKSASATKDVQIGIMTFYENKELEEKYLLEIGVSCGFIKLKLGLEDCKKIILKTLEASEAKGRRKFIRVFCENKFIASFNIKVNNGIFTGSIIDISSVGMACSFDDDKKIKIEEGTTLNDIQLRLKGILCKAMGKIAVVRKSEPLVYVIMFDIEKMKHERDKIHNFIRIMLQEYIEKELLTL